MMNSSEFATRLSGKLKLPKTEVSKRMNDVAEIVKAELLKGNTITLGHIGSLEVKKRSERLSVSPVSGKRMLIPPKLVIKFKVSSSLKGKLKK
ncbi:MAG: HU family DNA-binding protein [Dysgonamonadaceae bacterium]|jgi:nucleoid DNA-binding protein|nr:HU family DNA-binding protein [Dysgonamonadaceae bacterium]